MVNLIVFGQRLERASQRKGTMNCIGTAAFLMDKVSVETNMQTDEGKFQVVGKVNPVAGIKPTEVIGVGVYDHEIKRYVHMGVATPTGKWVERQGRGAHLETISVEEGIARIRSKYENGLETKKVEVRLLK